MMTESLKRQKCLALLLDPDSYSADKVNELTAGLTPDQLPDFLFVGGSITKVHPGELITELKRSTDIPVVLFPGNLLQLNDEADSILLLSLISGRNPELLIGTHVTAAPFLKKMKSEIIPTGYILINCGVKTSVEYISQTEAIPALKTDIAVATAIAGEMLGLKLIYLEGGSGASHPVPPGLIRSVRENVSVPIIVGGGLRSAEHINDAYEAGADLLVMGNGYEDNPGLLKEACSVRNRWNLNG